MNADGRLCAKETDPAQCNSTGAEGKMAAAAARIRARNPRAPVLMYYTCDNIRVESDLGRWFLSHPELLLRKTDKRSGAFEQFEYDWSQPAAVEAWASGVAAAVKKGGMDGVFIDGYQGWHECEPSAEGGGELGAPWHLSGCQSLLGGVTTAVGNRTVNQTAYLRGLWFESGPALAKALGPSAVMIPNCEGGYGCQDGTGRSRIP